MTLSIEYKLSGTGWSECLVSADGECCEISASYLSDALGKLIMAGAAVLADVHSISVGFDEEPGEYRWSITHAPENKIAVSILEFRELWGGRPDAEGKALISFTCAPLEFGRAVYDAACAVRDRDGIKGYEKKWAQHPFPTAQLDLLHNYIRAWERNR